MLIPIDFNEKPKTISEYVFGALPTRENFTSFLILSFAVSRGRPEIQRIFFMLLEKTVGFHANTVFKKFVLSGGFDALSIAEQKKFTDAFLNVRKHSEKYVPFEFEDEIVNELAALHERPMSEDALNEALTFFDFSKTVTMHDFATSTAKFIAQHPLKS